MPVIRTFVSHHGGDLKERVEPILRRVAPFGIRPWLDKRDLGDRVGLPLADQLQEAIFNGPCSSLSLFLTKSAATRPWIEQEVQWTAAPALDLRLDLDGQDDFCPAEADWREMEQALRTLRSNLGGLEQLNICGQAPLGVGLLLGKVWDRCSGLNGSVHLSSYNMKSRQIWTTNAEDYELAADWTPEGARQVHMDRPSVLRQRGTGGRLAL